MTTWISRAGLLLCLFALGGCTSFWQLGQPHGARDGASSSLVDYLYPKGEQPPEQTPAIPRLQLPLRVGIAFVPTRYGTSTIPEATRTELFDGVRAAFIDREYIEHIEVIPDTYLRSANGFDGMQQVARLYGVDVMALVSYDLVSVSEDRKSSFLYWTIVGAYIIKGTENEVNTFVDTAVFDVATRRLLFRAPGTSQLQVRSTAIESPEALRTGRAASFTTAVEEMTDNLVVELDSFEARLEGDPGIAEIAWRDGSSGGGSTGLTMLSILVIVYLTQLGYGFLARNRNLSVRR